MGNAVIDRMNPVEALRYVQEQPLGTHWINDTGVVWIKCDRDVWEEAVPYKTWSIRDVDVAKCIYSPRPGYEDTFVVWSMM